MKTEFWKGARDELPLLVGVAPFGMIYGALALEAGLPAPAAQAMSAIVFAGSSQFLAAQLFAAEAPGMIIVLSIAVINLRHALYSASVAPYLRPLRNAWKWLLAYLLTDEAYAVTIVNYQKPETEGDSTQRHWYFLGAGLTLWTSWQISTALGILLGTVIPETWPLDFTLALTFIALMVPGLKDRAGAAAALSAGIVALAVRGLPFKLALVIAPLVGIAVGMLVGGRKNERVGRGEKMSPWVEKTK
jgi:4-azaleucine resistance transporter AzlC